MGRWPYLMRPDVEEQEDAEHEGLKLRLLQSVFFYKDEVRIFLLEEEKKKSGGKRVSIWRFGEFFLFSFFSPSFHFPRSWGKKREESGSAFHLERASRRLKGNQFHWNETEKNNNFGRKLNYKQSQDQSFFPIWQVSHCSKDFWLKKRYMRMERLREKDGALTYWPAKNDSRFFKSIFFSNNHIQISLISMIIGYSKINAQ